MDWLHKLNNCYYMLYINHFIIYNYNMVFSYPHFHLLYILYTLLHIFYMSDYCSMFDILMGKLNMLECQMRKNLNKIHLGIEYILLLNKLNSLLGNLYNFLMLNLFKLLGDSIYKLDYMNYWIHIFHYLSWIQSHILSTK